jgi:hypothetical protein
MPVWYEPGDRLDIRLRVTNETTAGLEGYRIRVGVRDRVLSRLALAQSYETEVGLEPSTVPIEFSGTIPAGESATVTLDEPIAGFPTLAGAVEGGVFPATLSVQEPSEGGTLGTLTVPLIYHPERPERPLDLSLLVPLNDLPGVEPDGSLAADHLEAALLEGWLSGYVAALEAATRPSERRSRRPDPIGLSLAPSPRLIEELGVLAGRGDDPDANPEVGERAAEVLRTLRSILGREGVEHVLVPYGFPDLPTVIEELPIGHTIEQFSEAQEIWSQELGIDLAGPWVYPPAGRIHSASLEQLQLLGHGRRVFFSPPSLVPLPSTSAGCPEVFLSFTCAIRVETVEGTTEGLITDQILNDRLLELRGGANDRIGVQRVLAETAMIHEELPGTRGRVIHATIPTTWQPTPRMARLLIRGIQRAPWLRTHGGDDAFERSAQVVEREAAEAIERVAGAPEESFYRELERTREILDSFGSAMPPNNSRLKRLRRNLLVATSRTWAKDADRGSTYVSASAREVDAEMDKVTLSGPDDITLTSRRAPVQLVLSNETDHPIRLALHLDSPNLEFEDERIVDTYPPGNRTLTLETTARGSGVFQLSARLQTTDGRYLVDEERIVVRSTSFNVVALGLTVGAFIFLVLFFIFKALRKQPEASEASR